MEEKIVYNGLLHGLEIKIRYPLPGDEKPITKYINTLSDERTFLSFQGEQETIESQKEFLDHKSQSVNEGKAVIILAFCGNEIIGVAEIQMDKRTSRHIGLLAIAVAKKYRGIGLGKILMENIINEALEKLKDLEIIILGVFARNTVAINMYKKFGFKEEGRLPNGVKLENGYDDHIFMYKVVK